MKVPPEISIWVHSLDLYCDDCSNIRTRCLIPCHILADNPSVRRVPKKATPAMISTTFLGLALIAAAATPLEAGWHNSPEQRLEISSPADCRKWFESQDEDEGVNVEVTIQSQGAVVTDDSHEQLSGCRRKVVKSRGGKKVEMSPCLVPSSNVRGRRPRQRLSYSSSSTGTNTNLDSTASTSHLQHHHNTIDSELDGYRQLQELLRQKNIPLTVPVLVVVDCKIDEKARKEEESHDRQRRRTHAKLPPEKGFTTLYALAVLLVAFVVSRLKVKIEFKLDLGGHQAVEADAPAVPVVVADASVPPIVMVDAVAINNYEPQAVAVQG